jgi:hypothetical protein
MPPNLSTPTKSPINPTLFGFAGCEKDIHVISKRGNNNTFFIS